MDFDYIQLTATIFTLIEDGTIVPGECIPSERDLCQQYNTSRTTVRRAIEDLVNKKILVKKPGKGTFVAKMPELETKKTGYVLFLRCMHSKLNFNSFLADDILYPNILSGIEIGADKSDYHCLVKTINENEDDYSSLETLKGKIDGIICGEMHNRRFLEYLLTFDLPLVLVSPSVETSMTDSIIIDNINGAFDATNYLISKGHKRIAFIGGSVNSLPAKERKNGFLKAMNEAQLNVDVNYILDTNWLQSDGYDGFHILWEVENRPTAIVAASDLLALGARNGAIEKGLSIPDDLSIIGFDGISTAQHYRPELATMFVRALAIGEVAFRLFYEQMNGVREYPVKIAIPTELIEGESVKSI